MATTTINPYVTPPTLTVAQGAIRPNSSYNQRSIRNEKNKNTQEVAKKASDILKSRGVNVEPQTLANAFNVNQRSFVGANAYSQAFGPANFVSGDTQQAAARWYSSPTEIADAYQNYYSQDAVEKRTGIKLPSENFFVENNAVEAKTFYDNPKTFFTNELKALGTNYYNLFINPDDFGRNKPTPKALETREVAKEALKKEIETIVKRAATAGFSIEDSAKILTDQAVADYTFNYNAYSDIERKNASGILGFVGKALPFITNAGFSIVTGGLSLPYQIGINATAALVQGAKPEDVLKSIVGTVAASQVPDVLKAVKATSSNEVLNAGIENAFKQATYAQVTGQDVAKSGAAGFVGGVTAAGVAKASDSAAIGRATGEYTQAISAGQSPEQAMFNALSSFADSEMDEARRKIEAESVKKKADGTASIEGATPYYPQYGQKLAALEGSEVGGKTVIDVNTSKASEQDPLLFSSGYLRYSPETQSVGDIYNVKNEQGEVFQARDVTYQNGAVSRIIFDPNTETYKQQVLKDASGVQVSAGSKVPIFSVAEESAFLDELKNAAVTGDLRTLISATQKAELPATIEAQKFFEAAKPESKEFKQSLLKLPTQDLRDLTGLLSAGAGKDSPFSGDALTKLQSDLDTAETRANELLAKATADPTAENLSAATQAQNDALTAKFQLSQALLMPKTDIAKADLSVYNKYPEATQKFIDDGQVVYAKGTGAPGSPVEILGSEPYVAPELKFLPSGARAPTTGQGEGVSDLEALKQLSLVRGQPLGQNLRYQMNQAKVAANEALVALQSANTPETVQAARDALANYELSQKMYTQVAGEEFSVLPDEKLATQEFPLVDEAVKTGQMMALSNVMPMTPAQRYAQYKRLSGQKDGEEGSMGDTGLGIAVLPRFEGMMEPQMFARGGLAALRRI